MGPQKPDQGDGIVSGGPAMGPPGEQGGPPPGMMDRAEAWEGTDGLLIVDLEPPEDPASDPTLHDANLAEHIDDASLSKLAGELKEQIEADKTSRTEWEAAYVEGMTLLGLKVTDRTFPFKGACGVFDSTMLDATIRWQATARGEFLPNAGPVKTRIVGDEDDEVSARADRVQAWMNYYLTRGAPEYYPDRDQMFFWLPVVGSMFTKTYNDPILGRPTQPYITPDKLVVNYAATSLATASRISHLIDMSKRDVMLRQMGGYWKNVELGGAPTDVSRSQTKQKTDSIEGRQPSISDGDYEYRIIECHADIDLEAYLDGNVSRTLNSTTEGGLPLPYIVTFDLESLKVLCLKRNWKEGDERRDRRRFFTHHKFLPGFGFYGLGYSHVLASPAKTLTAIQRQIVDAGTLKLFPGGLRAKGMRIEESNIQIGPMEFKEIDLGGASRIQDAIMPLPYEGADPNSIQFFEMLSERAKTLANTTEIAVGEGRQDAPVGTTVALLEAAMRPQSGINKRVHESLTEEFGLLATLFGEVLPEEPYPFPVEGGEKTIMRSDFDGRIDIIPVSDPNVSSSAQRMMRAEVIQRFAATDPDLYNKYEAHKRMLEEMNVRDVDMLLKPPPQPAQPMDPLTENVAAMKGQPLTVGPEQDDDSHIIVHGALLTLPPGPPPAPNTPPTPNPATIMGQLHIAEHKASRARKTAFQMLGIPQSPPPNVPLPPEIENAVAQVAAYQAEQDQQNAAQQQAQANSEMAQAMQADASAKLAAVKGKITEANIKAAVERYKADLNAEVKKRSDETKIRLAQIKSVTDLTRNAFKPPPQIAARPGIGASPTPNGRLGIGASP